MPGTTRGNTSGHRKKQKKKKKQLNKKLLLFIDFALVVVFLFSLIMLTVEIVQYISARHTYKEIANSAITVNEEEEMTSSEENENDISTEESDTIDNETVTEEEETEETEATVTKRKLSTEPGISVDWETLKKENSDVYAWLYCPGTTINYPVVYPEDNDYYMNHDFYGKSDEGGTLFFDYCTNLKEEGPGNWIIYGHRRNDKSMFGILSRFGEESFLKRFPNMYLLTEEHSYRVELFACRTIRADIKYFPTWFADETELKAYVNKALEQSYWVTDVKVQPDDIILTMVTCNKYDVASDPRLLLHGRLVALD